MADTVFVRGAGGSIFEMDVPTQGMALARWEEKLAKGELFLVDEAHWVDVDPTTRKLVEGPAPKAGKPAPAPAASSTPTGE